MTGMCEWRSWRFRGLLFAIVITAPMMLSCGDDGSDPVTGPPPVTYAWSSMSSGVINDLRGAWGTSSTNVYVAGYNGTILKYDGTAWSSMGSNTGEDLLGIWGASNDTIFAVGKNRTILTYNGSAWAATQYPETANVPAATNFLSVWGTSGTNVYVTCSNGVILHYDGTWSEMNIVTSEALHCIWGGDATNVLAVGNNGVNLVHAAGSGWSELNNTVTSEHLRAVAGTSWSDAFVVGDAGEILYFGNGFLVNWRFAYGTPGFSLYAVWPYDVGKYIAAGRLGQVVRISMTINGGSWSVANTPTTERLYGLWGTSETDVFAVGAKGVIVHYGPE